MWIISNDIALFHTDKSYDIHSKSTDEFITLTDKEAEQIAVIILERKYKRHPLLKMNDGPHNTELKD